MERPRRQPTLARAEVHPASCRFCGGAEFWELHRGPVHSHGVDKGGKRWSAWDFRYAVRCTKCPATFNATSATHDDDGGDLKWHLGRNH